MKTTAADTTQLAPADAESLHEQVRAAGLFDLPSDTTGAGQPDTQNYEITVSDDARDNTVVLGERNLSPEVRRLLAWLRAVPGHEESTGY